jgi:hypothetical protein
MTAEEHRDMLRRLAIKAARAAGVPESDPDLAAASAFDLEVTLGRRYEAERGLREEEQRQADWKARGEAAAAAARASLEAAQAYAALHPQQSGRRGRRAQVIVPPR